jgi:hypothetical protein
MVQDVERVSERAIRRVVGRDGPRRNIRIRHTALPRIGGGFQYNVYDLANGRVFKCPVATWQCYARIFAWRFPFRDTSVWSLRREVRQIRIDAARSLEMIRPLLPRVSHDLGNPFFLGDLCYEQDRATVLEDYFRSHSLSESKDAIDQYIVLLFRLWEHGFNDRPFKFHLNFGMNKSGNVILLDLGELYFEKEKALERIKARLWERVHLCDEVLDAYYHRVMAVAMTTANVEARWGQAL